MPPLDCDWQSQLKTQDAFWHMQKNQVGCDLVFEVGPQKERVGAHSFVLMSRSTRFFHDHLTFKASQFIQIPEVTSITFKEFLRFLYTDVMDYTNWKETLYLANKYEVKPLIEQIFDKKLCKSSADEFCYIIRRNEDMDGYLEYRCLKYVFDNTKLIFECNSFYNLPHSFVLKLLSSEYLVLDENLIYNALFLWAEKACYERRFDGTGVNKKEVLGDILYEIRFPLLPQDFFSDHVSEQGLVDEADEIKILKYYLHPKKPVGDDFKFKTEQRKAPEAAFRYIPSKFERWRPSFEGCKDEASASGSSDVTGSSEVRSSDQDVSLSLTASTAYNTGACGPDGKPVRHPDGFSMVSKTNFTDELETDLWRMERFNERDIHSGWGYKKETVDAIAVVSSGDIALSAIGFYGVEPGRKMTGRFKIYQGNKEGWNQEFSFTCYKERKIYDIYLSQKVKFCANEEYHILVDLEEGLNGFYGKNGKSQIKAGTTSFSIKPSKYSTNQTDVNMGQIFGFIFRIFKPMPVKYGLQFSTEEKPRY